MIHWHWHVGLSDAFLVPLFQVSFIAVNGQYQPVIPLVAGSAALLRAAYLSVDMNAVLKLSHPQYCTLTLIARDGIFQRDYYVNITRMAFVPSTRQDIAVVCVPPLNATYPFVVTVRADETDYGPMNGHVVVQDVVFTFSVTLPQSSFPRIMVPTSMAPFP